MPGEDALLGGELAVGALEEAAAEAGIFTLGVLADDVEVDVLLGASGKRGSRAGHQLAGADAGVLIEAAADGDQEAPERDVVGDTGPADGTEKDGVVLAELVEAVLGHHGAELGVTLTGPVVVGCFQTEAEAGGGGFEHAQALGDGLFADAVTGHGSNLVGALHSAPFRRRTLNARSFPV